MEGLDAPSCEQRDYFALAGELERMRDLGEMSVRDLKRRHIFRTESTAFCLQWDPPISSIPIATAAEMSQIPNLEKAIKTFYATNGRARRGGMILDIFGGYDIDVDDEHLNFTEIKVWTSMRVQTTPARRPGANQSHVVYAHPPLTSNHEQNKLLAKSVGSIQQASKWKHGRYNHCIFKNDMNMEWNGKVDLRCK